jgi:hypothetical protein
VMIPKASSRVRSTDMREKRMKKQPYQTTG